MSKLIEMLKNPPEIEYDISDLPHLPEYEVDYDKQAKQIQGELLKLCFDGDMKKLIRDFCTGGKP